jgi:hypothetical protein
MISERPWPRGRSQASIVLLVIVVFQSTRPHRARPWIARARRAEIRNRIQIAESAGWLEYKQIASGAARQDIGSGIAIKNVAAAAPIDRVIAPLMIIKFHAGLHRSYAGGTSHRAASRT